MSTVNIFASCRSLPKTDVTSQADPIVIVKGKDGKVVAQTEWYQNNPNPDFTTPLAVPFTAGADNTYEFGVYDVDDKGQVRASDFVCKAALDIEQVLHRPMGSTFVMLDTKLQPANKGDAKIILYTQDAVVTRKNAPRGKVGVRACA